MKLKRFISLVGDQQAAEFFGVTQRTAQSWRLGSRKPDEENAKKIVERTRDLRVGKIKYPDIYG